MRLPGDATLIIVAKATPSASDDGALSRDRHARIATLQAGWRRAGLPVVHVQQSPPLLDPGDPGAIGLGEEPRLSMSGDDLFLGTGLEDMLTQRGATTIVLCGSLGESETAVDQACRLGFRTFVVVDASDGLSTGWDRAAGVGTPDAHDSAINVDTATALAAAARAGAWRNEKVKR